MQCALQIRPKGGGDHEKKSESVNANVGCLYLKLM